MPYRAQNLKRHHKVVDRPLYSTKRTGADDIPSIYLQIIVTNSGELLTYNMLCDDGDSDGVLNVIVITVALPQHRYGIVTASSPNNLLCYGELL
jgi:hypothetical protein